MIEERPLTDGTIALLNLDGQIEAFEPEVNAGHASVETRAGLTELISLRGLILGRIADYEKAEDFAEQLVLDAPTDPKSSALARERAPAFIDLTMLWTASIGPSISHSMPTRLTLSVPQSTRLLVATMKPLSCERKPQSANQALKMSPPWSDCLASAANPKQQNGSTSRAAADIAAFRHFHWLCSISVGLMWMNGGRLDDARRSFEAAWRRVPAYAQAQGHLAEVEAELDEVDSAISRLHSLAETSDDPDYAAQLARILEDVGDEKRVPDLARAGSSAL